MHDFKITKANSICIILHRQLEDFFEWEDIKEEQSTRLYLTLSIFHTSLDWLSQIILSCILEDR